MISWLQRVLQRHYKWLFSVMLAIIIVAFVFTIGASPGIGRTSRKDKKEMYYGYNLNSQEELKELFRNANISNLLNTGRNIPNTQLAEQMALTRPPLLSLADELQIPDPNEYEITEYIKSKPLFKDSNGNFDAAKYKDFLNLVKRDPNLNEDTVRDALAEDYRMDMVTKTVGSPGFVLPYEAQLSLERQETTWSINVATLDYQDLKSELSVTKDVLEEYYKKYKFDYATPSKVSVSYAFFPAKNYVSSVETPSEDELKNFYDTNLNLFEDPEENTKPFEEIKSKVLKAYKEHQAKRLAAESANDFLYSIYENDIQKDSKEFLNLLHENKVSLTELPPYEKNDLPKNTDLPTALLKQAFSLNDKNYYSDAVNTKNGAAILFFKESHPIAIPQIGEIENQLKQRYTADQSLKLLESKSKILDKTLRKALKNGDSFTSTAKKQDLKVESFNDFKILAAPKGLSKFLLPELQTLSQGQLSQPILRDDKCYFVYVTKKEVPAVSQSSEKVKELLSKLEPYTASATVQTFINEMVSSGMKQLSTK